MSVPMTDENLFAWFWMAKGRDAALAYWARLHPQPQPKPKAKK